MNNLIKIKRDPYIKDVAILCMNDKKNKNTFTDEFIDSFLRELDKIKSDKFKVVVLRGLPDIFCAGATKEKLLSFKNKNIINENFILSEKIINFPLPIIAAMEGSALGGGFVMALCCDVVIMNERMMYGTNFMNMAFTPGMGCTRLLKLLVGNSVATEMLLGGRLIKGKHFKNKGLVNYVLHNSKVYKKAIDVAYDFSEKPIKLIKMLKNHLNLDKKKLLIEAKSAENQMHQISFGQLNINKLIKNKYST